MQNVQTVLLSPVANDHNSMHSVSTPNLNDLEDGDDSASPTRPRHVSRQQSGSLKVPSRNHSLQYSQGSLHVEAFSEGKRGNYSRYVQRMFGI